MVNRATIEALVKCGAFDRVHGTESRAALLEALDTAIAGGHRAQQDRASGQSNLFGMLATEDDPVATPSLPCIADWPMAEKLKHEKDVLGFYVSSHPLDEHIDLVDRFSNVAATELGEISSEAEIVIGGLITGVKKRIIQRGRSQGKTMAILAFEDRTGPVEAVAFSEVFERYGELFEEDRVVFLIAKVQQRDGMPNLMVNRVVPLEQAATLTASVRVKVEANGDAAKLSQRLQQLRDLLLESTTGPGSPASVKIEVVENGEVVTIGLNGFQVKVTPELPKQVAKILGSEDCCRLYGPPRPAPAMFAPAA